MTHWRTLQTGCGFALLTLNELAEAVTVNMAEVSVCQDATFQIPTSRGAVCSGYGGAQPIGVQCPRVGDTALDACHPYLDSFNGVNCVAKEDAQCVRLEGRHAWGCTFPSTWCADMWKTPEETAHDSCLTWEFYEVASNVDLFDIAIEDAVDPAWFTKTSRVAKLYNCKTDSPAVVPIQDTAIPTTPSEIPVYTMAPVVTNTNAPQVETVVAAIVEAPVIVTSRPSEAPVLTEQVTAIPVVQESPVPTELTSWAPIVESPVPTNPPETSLPIAYLEPTPTETFASISPTSTLVPEESTSAPPETPTSPPATEIPTVTPFTDEVETLTPTYETLLPSTPVPELTRIPQTETSTVPITTSPPVPITTATPWYPTQTPPIVPETYEPASTTAPHIATLPATEMPQPTEIATPGPAQEYSQTPLATATLAPASTPPTETTFPPYV
ncbi:hypothetical protein AM588_10008047 [Phytophthora nicotianae]|uniref:Uncharacterized protein n=1 Tax=Phytophthora nicotianae TaxID=4792 RepID=A0A0W8CF59_PHYNI|nr:hypothetical protein AM588_10008047 [Phytophthora nicotianae]